VSVSSLAVIKQAESIRNALFRKYYMVANANALRFLRDTVTEKLIGL
jgi:hypothetical protein